MNIFSVVLGIVFAVDGIRRLLKIRHLRKIGVAVTGEVIHVVQERRKKGGNVIVIRFHTPEGAECIADYRGVQYHDGQLVDIFYNPQNPDEIELADSPLANRLLPYVIVIFLL